MTICLTLSHCGLLIRRIKSDLLTAIIKWSQLAPIKPHGSRASIQSSAKFSVSFTHHSLPWFIFLKSIKYVSYQVELNFLVYTSSRQCVNWLCSHTEVSCRTTEAILPSWSAIKGKNFLFIYLLWNWSPCIFSKQCTCLNSSGYHKWIITLHLTYFPWSFSTAVSAFSGIEYSFFF